MVVRKCRLCGKKLPETSHGNAGYCSRKCRETVRLSYGRDIDVRGNGIMGVACAVIWQAIHDATHGDKRAYQWLFASKINAIKGDGLGRAWMEALGLDPDAVKNQIDELMKG